MDPCIKYAYKRTQLHHTHTTAIVQSYYRSVLREQSQLPLTSHMQHSKQITGSCVCDHRFLYTKLSFKTQKKKLRHEKADASFYLSFYFYFIN